MHTSKEPRLLVKEAASLCLNCHKIDSQVIKAAHKNLTLEKARCQTCHNPHASDKTGLVVKFLHKPFGDGNCAGCHDMKNQNPSATLKMGSDLCFMCHHQWKENLMKAVVHYPVGKGECLPCHLPHGSEEAFLLVKTEREMCLNCHLKIKEQINSSKFNHPIKAGGGKCTACHVPHSAPEKYLFPAGSIEVCAICHKNQGSFSHPVGPKAIDPRSSDGKGFVTCVSCHDPHGTQYEFILRLQKDSELCIQCHKK